MGTSRARGVVRDGWVARRVSATRACMRASRDGKALAWRAGIMLGMEICSSRVTLERSFIAVDGTWALGETV